MKLFNKNIKGKSLGVLAMGGAALAFGASASVANAASYCGTSSCAPSVVTSHVQTHVAVPVQTAVTVVQPRMTVVHRPVPVVRPACISPCGTTYVAPAPCYATSCGVMAAPVYMRRSYHHVPVVRHHVMQVMRPAVHVAYPMAPRCGRRC